MKNKKEEWIEEVLQSAKSIGPVASNSFMTTRIEAKLQHKPAPQVALRWVYATAGAMAIILLINVAAWRTVNRSARENAALQQLVQEYGWTSHDIYSNSN